MCVCVFRERERFFFFSVSQFWPRVVILIALGWYDADGLVLKSVLAVFLSPPPSRQ